LKPFKEHPEKLKEKFTVGGREPTTAGREKSMVTDQEDIEEETNEEKGRSIEIAVKKAGEKGLDTPPTL